MCAGHGCSSRGLGSSSPLNGVQLSGCGQPVRLSEVLKVLSFSFSFFVVLAVGGQARLRFPCLLVLRVACPPG